MPAGDHDIDSNIERINEFWFGSNDEERNDASRLKLWFGGGKAVDDDIRNRFEDLLLDAESDKLNSWQNTARGCLALIILLDQFPLNIYRKSARAFAFEARAIRACKHGLDQEFDQKLTINERSFFYMPLEHSEAAEDQAMSVALFQQLHKDAPEALKSMAEKTLEYALEHQQTIARFGRYPYRNEVLGRESTDAEKRYLNDNPKRYGQ